MDTVTREQCIKTHVMALSTGVPAVGLAMPGPDGQLMHVVASALIQKIWLHLLGPAMLDLDLRPAKRQTPHGRLAKPGWWAYGFTSLDWQSLVWMIG